MNEQQLSALDCNDILKSVFLTTSQNKEDALNFVVDNFTKQQNLVPIIVDFYMNNDFLKPVIDLLCKVPDVQHMKIFDKLNDYYKQSNVKLDKIMKLLVSLVYNTKMRNKWCQKLLQHQLFANLIRTLNTKSTAITNNFMIIQICSLFLIILENTPLSQIGNENHQNMFQIVLNSLKSLISNECQYKKQANASNEASTNSVKWSIKLFLYAFYGLFPHAFLSNLRKKDNLTISKDVLNSIISHLRLHPALIKEKADNFEINSSSIEWTQYCLDKNYTSLNHLTFENCLNEAANNQLASLQRQISTSVDTPLSPTYKQFSIASNQSSTTTQTNLSTTSAVFSFSSNEALNLSQQEQQPVDVAEQPTAITSKPIKNLTAQFSQDVQSHQHEEFGKIKPLDDCIRKKIEGKKLKNSTANGRCSVYFGNEFSLASYKTNLTRNKSLSDSNLSGLQNELNEIRKKAKTAIGEPLYNNENDKTKQQTRSEMRDSNIIRDPLFLLNNQQNEIVSFSPTSMQQSEAFNFYLNDSSSKTKEALSSYLSRALNKSESKLKTEYEMLCHELVYERYLREKYEEFFNKTCAIRLENEQLSQEKADLEESLRKAIEYQNSLRTVADEKLSQHVKKLADEMDGKNNQLNHFKQKESDLDAKQSDMQKKFDELFSNFQNLEKKLNETQQELEKEQNYNKQHENEGGYVKALRSTNDDLRKKLLIMTKCANSVGANNTGSNAVKYNQIFVILLDEIDELKRRIRELEDKKLLALDAHYKEKDAAITELERTLTQKGKQIDDLNQQINNTISHVTVSMYKSNSRVYRSALAINGRLETEIIKLKGEISDLKAQLKLE